MYLDENDLFHEIRACYPLNGTIYFYFLNEIWIWIDLCIFCLIPFFIMLISSFIIISRIRSKGKNYFTTLIKSKTNQLNKNNLAKRLKRNRQILYMLLLTNFYFLFSLLPYCVSFILLNSLHIAHSFGQLLIHIFMYTNNAFNFIFYGILSQKYRMVLNSLCTKTRPKNELFTM